MLITGTPLFSFFLVFICIGLILAAGLHDVIARTVPNSLVLMLSVAAIAAATIDGHLAASLLVAGIVFAVTAFCWRRGWMGGGDVKLLGAAVLAMPPNSVLTFVAAVAIAGGLLAVFYLAGRRLVHAPASLRPNSLLRRSMRVERWRISRGGPLPYACAIAAGFVIAIM